MWDVFISHASEDKETVALPLAQELEKYCLRVWLDKWLLSPGDSLRKKIDEGLMNSSLGVVILSEKFFAKNWPQAELDALYAMAISGDRLLFPIWHGLTDQRVRQLSPLMSGLFAASTRDGVESLAAAVGAKLGCKGNPLSLEVESREYVVVGGAGRLAADIAQSEDAPGSSSKRRIVVSFLRAP